MLHLSTLLFFLSLPHSRNQKLGMDDGDRAKDRARDQDPQSATKMMIPTWKLYENPYYIIPGSNRSARGAEVGNINMDGGDDSGVCALGKFVMELMEPELEGLRSRLEEMRSRVEHERKVRKKAERTSEWLSRELAEERGARVALERMCERLAKELRDERESGERLRAEIEEERRFLRAAEVLREERVQTTLAEARAALEDRICKLEGKVNGSREDEEEKTTTVVADGYKDKGSGEKDRDQGKNAGNAREIELSVGDHGQGKGTGRRPSPEPENPHITRGIKGFVEFPRGIRGVGSRSSNGRSWGPGKVEYHRAQIRILLKQSGSPVKSD